jgi:hypothetical protein
LKGRADRDPRRLAQFLATLRSVLLSKKWDNRRGRQEHVTPEKEGVRGRKNRAVFVSRSARVFAGIDKIVGLAVVMARDVDWTTYQQVFMV